MVEVSCPHCGVKLKAPEDRVGKKARCAKCQKSFRVVDPVPMAESVGEPEMLGMPLPNDDEDDRTELMTADQLPPLAPIPPLKAKPTPPPVPVPAKDLAELPSADPFDFGKPAVPAATAAKPAVGAAKPAPAAPVPVPAPVPTAKPVLGSAKSNPVAKVAKSEPSPLSIDDEPAPLAGIPIDEPEPLPKNAKPKPKAKAKAAPEPEPEPMPADDAFAFGFADEPAPAESAKSKQRDELAELAARARKKKKRGEDDSETEEPENTPHYRRPGGKAKGMIKALFLTGVAGAFALGLGIAAVVVYKKNNKPPAVKKEEKQEDPEPPAPPPNPNPVPPKIEPKVIPPKIEPKVEPKVVPPKVEPKVETKTEPKIEPKVVPPVPPKVEPKKVSDPKPSRAGLELRGKFQSFEISKEKEAAKFEQADQPGKEQVVLDTAFASVLRVFPPVDPKNDTYVVVREGAKLSLDGYSASSDKRLSRMEFAGGTAQPICDVFESPTDKRFLAVSNDRLTVWDLADNKNKVLLDAIDPYKGKPEHQNNGIAAAFFSTQPSQVVVVSTAGAVHLYSIPAQSEVAKFEPPHGAKGKVVLGESVARVADGGSIVLAVGGFLYQIRSGGNLERLREYDLKGDVKPLAVAASGTPGRLLLACETGVEGKKDRALVYLPLGAKADATITLWPAAAGTPKEAFWVSETSAAVVAESGITWFYDNKETNKFVPVVVTRPATTGLYLGSKDQLWYVVGRPTDPKQSFLVTLTVPFRDAFDFRREAETRVRVVRIDQNGLAK